MPAKLVLGQSMAMTSLLRRIQDAVVILDDFKYVKLKDSKTC